MHIYGFIPACAQVDKLTPLYFNLRHFSNRSSNRLLRSNAKSTQYVQPQTFAASESVSYPALSCPAISCPAFSCPVIWSVISRPAFSASPTIRHRMRNAEIFEIYSASWNGPEPLTKDYNCTIVLCTYNLNQKLTSSLTLRLHQNLLAGVLPQIPLNRIE